MRLKVRELVQWQVQRRNERRTEKTQKIKEMAMLRPSVLPSVTLVSLKPLVERKMELKGPGEELFQEHLQGLGRRRKPRKVF